MLSSDLFFKFKEGLKLTRNLFRNKLKVFSNVESFNKNILNELESFLIESDVGVCATENILNNLKLKINFKEKFEVSFFNNILRSILISILKNGEKSLFFDSVSKTFVMLMVGVNGVGKTTTVGKLARNYNKMGKNVILCAGDTQRFAAIDQIKILGKYSNVPVVSHCFGADSASVAFDSLSSSHAKKKDLLIIDTAGRLHTNIFLMDELKKIIRVLKKLDNDTPHEIILVIDATLGQNSLNQVKEFYKNIGITGICLTKMDSSFKGGMVFSIIMETKIPILYVGFGENMDDLKPFSAENFVDAMFGFRL